MRIPWCSFSSFIKREPVGRRRVITTTICKLQGIQPVRPFRRLHANPRSCSTGVSRGQATREKVTLRPYQEESINAVLAYLAQGENRLGLSLATGSGKTVIFSHLIDRVVPPNQNATQTLVLAHRRELVQQAARHCHQLYPDKTIELEMGHQHATGVADITIASIQSLLSGQRLIKYNPAAFKLILVDEAHHIVAPQYLDVLRHFQIIGHNARCHIALVGVSATFSRFDGLKLGAVIDHIVYHKDYIDMIEDEWLSKVIFTTVKSGADLSNVAVSRGDFQSGALSKAVNTAAGNSIIVRTWLDRAQRRKSTLVFCVDIAHLTALTAAFRRHGVDARSVKGDTPNKQRADTLEAFKNAEFPVLLNCAIFTEGTDIPNIDCVLLARPTRSRNLLIQMLGRGLRKHVGKDDCHVIDMVSSLESGIVTVPTLFGLDPNELVENAAVTDLEALRDRKRGDAESGKSGAPRASPALEGALEFTDYDTVHDLIEDTSGERHIRALSRNAWVCVTPARFILLVGTGGDYLTIQKDGEVYVVFHTRRLPAGASAKSPFARPRRIAEGVTSLTNAVHAADTFVAAKSKLWPRELMLWRAGWRQRPASEAQIAVLNKSRDEHMQLTSREVTKGQAIDWITKIKHGARGQFRHLAIRKRKDDRVKQRYDEVQRLSQVQVGPLRH